MAGSPLEGVTSLSMGFDQVYPTGHELYPAEQVLDPIRKQLAIPVSVIATATPVGMSYLTGHF